MSAEHNTKENIIIAMEFYFKGNNIQYNTKTELLLLLLLFFLHLFYNVTLNYLLFWSYGIPHSLTICIKNDVFCLLNWKGTLPSYFALKFNWGLGYQSILKIEGNKRIWFSFQMSSRKQTNKLVYIFIILLDFWKFIGHSLDIPLIIICSQKIYFIY